MSVTGGRGGPSAVSAAFNSAPPRAMIACNEAPEANDANEAPEANDASEAQATPSPFLTPPRMPPTPEVPTDRPPVRPITRHSDRCATQGRNVRHTCRLVLRPNLRCGERRPPPSPGRVPMRWQRSFGELRLRTGPRPLRGRPARTARGALQREEVHVQLHRKGHLRVRERNL